MSKPALPTETDVGAFLLSAKLVSAPPTPEQAIMLLGDAVAAAHAEWERGTGWVPFLSGADTTRAYDPPGPDRGPVGIYLGVANIGGARRLFLNAGVRSVTALKVGITVANPTGSTLTLNTDYWLRPMNAGASDRPYTYVEFAVPQYGNPNSITVTAPFGFAATCPDDAWYAILKMAACHAVPSLEAAITGGMLSISLGNDSFKMGPRPFQGIVEQWQSQAEAVCGRYKRKIIA